MKPLVSHSKTSPKLPTPKILLQAAGHELDVHNLLTEPWTPERLRSFFGTRLVKEWFNPTAPQVKSGEVVPDQVDGETALALMVQSPILIRRPLIQVGDRQEVGFDLHPLTKTVRTVVVSRLGLYV